MVDLKSLQVWMQRAVTCPESDREAEMGQAVHFIKSGYGLDPASRLWIYRSMYPARMIEALQVDFPGLRHALGEDVFEALVMRYVEVHPSSSWTLNRLGTHLPGFVKSDKLLPGRSFLAELSQLELSLAQVFDEPEMSALSPTGLLALSSDDWMNLSLQPLPTVRLMKFKYPVSSYLHQVDQGLGPVRPRLQEERVLVLRNSYRMNRVLLPAAGFLLLQQLFRGIPLGRALEKLASSHPDVSPEDLRRWFREWSEWRIFRALLEDQ